MDDRVYHRGRGKLEDQRETCRQLSLVDGLDWQQDSLWRSVLLRLKIAARTSKGFYFKKKIHKDSGCERTSINLNRKSLLRKVLHKFVDLLFSFLNQPSKGGWEFMFMIEAKHMHLLGRKKGIRVGKDGTGSFPGGLENSSRAIMILNIWDFMPLKKNQLYHIACMCACSVAKSCLTLWDPWTVAHQAPLSMGFPRQEY